MEPTLVMLAGGASTRIGYLNNVMPKSTMLSYDEPTLIRNLRQAQDAGFREIIVSTRRKFFRVISDLLKSARFVSPNTVTIVSNQYHRYGPLPALLHVLKITHAQRIALSLADIFFLENAYHDLYTHSKTNVAFLGVAEPFDLIELSNGGLVICNGNHVEEIRELPSEGASRGARWSGFAVFNKALEDHLESFSSANENASAPIGEFFEHYRKSGNDLRVFWVSDFINVNTPSDLFVASLYRAIELNNQNSDVTKLLTKTTRSFRRHLLELKERNSASHLL